ncbi:MAG: hypothetical protein RL654_1063 [Pseudomonadota bacterium]|jgi:uncharacterized membrane protein YjgN (DUF898 family)
MTNTSDPDQHHTGTGQTLPIRFTASGRDYARLWRRNLGLTLITLGLYLPFARAHRLRFFREHTQVGGEALAFDGDGREMLRPHLLLCAVLLLYILIAHEMPLVAALLLLAALPFWPALRLRSLRWRLEHTRWRGRRLAFHGDAAGARAVFLPAAAPMAVLLIGQALLAGPQAEFDDSGGWLVPALVSLALLVLMLMLPWLHARHSRYRHAHFGLGEGPSGEHTRLEAHVEPRHFYRLHGGVLAGLAGALLINLLFATWIDTLLAAAPVLTGLLLDMTLLLALRAWLVAGTQTLLWSHTRSAHYRFSCHLPWPRLLLLALKNLLLCVLTLGLYWPHAVIATTRLRLESLTLSRTSGTN